MRRRFLTLAVLAALVPFSAGVSPAVAQEPEKLAFKTHDEVKIQGVLYKSAKGANSPTVIIMHSYGADPNKGNWAGLAKTLAAEGYNVLRYDFRGHGDSKVVNPTKFWSDAINANELKALARQSPDTIDLKQFPRGGGDYFYRSADDLMAARVALDQMNDNSTVNTRSVYLIGATDSVELGMLYLTAEWSRPQKLPPFWVGMGDIVLSPPPLNGIGMDTAGIDVAGAVWLSPTAHSGQSKKLVQQWVQLVPELRERTPMLFIAGDKDREGQLGARFFMDGVLAANGGGRLNKLPLTYARLIKGTNLQGVDLLGKDLGTEQMIVDYLNTLDKERQNLIRVTQRGFTSPPAINLYQFGVCK